MFRYALVFIFVFSFITPIENAFADEAKPETKTQEIKKEEKKPEEFQKIVPRDEASDSGYGKSTGVLGPVVMSPTITAIGFPSPFRFGYEFKGWNIAGLGFDYGFLPQLTFDNVKVKYNSWRITGRVYPFKGSLFVGVGVGKQKLTGTGTETVSGIPVDITAELNTTIITPHIGWRWIWQNGFMFGMEYGWQLASGVTTTISDSATATNPGLATQPAYINEKNHVEDQANKFGKKGLPHFALVQLGYFF